MGERRSQELERQMKDYTRTHYAQSWRSFVHDYAVKEQDYLQGILRFIAPQPGQAILECGIGTGEPLGLLVAQQAAKLFAVDIAPLLLEECRANFRRTGLTVRCCEADVESLPYADEVFDVVYCVSSTWYFPNPGKALGEMVRVLRLGGRLIFDVINLWHPTQFLTYRYVRFKMAWQVFWRHHRGLPIDDCVVNWRARTPRQLAKVLAELPVTYVVKGFMVLLPVSLPHLGPRANVCQYVPLFNTGLQDHSWLKYLGAKLVYVGQKLGSGSIRRDKL